MRVFLTSGLCVSAMLATGFSLAQEPAAVTRSFSSNSFPIGQNQSPAADTDSRTPSRPAPPVAPSPFSSAVQATSPRWRGPGLFNSNVAQPGYFYSTSRGSSKEERAVQKRIDTAQRQLTSEDIDAKDKAQEELKAAVGELFDMRTKSRRKQIEELEKRLAKLRKQLDQREDKKSEIIRLHVQTIVNQANGLGF